MAMIKVSALPWAWQAPPVRLVLQAPRPPGPPRAPLASAFRPLREAPLPLPPAQASLFI